MVQKICPHRVAIGATHGSCMQLLQCQDTTPDLLGCGRATPLSLGRLIGASIVPSESENEGGSTKSRVERMQVGWSIEDAYPLS